MPTWCATRVGCSRCASDGMPRAATRSRRRRASRPSSAASLSSWRSREPAGRCRHPVDATIPRHQGALSADHLVLPDGRLLRDVRGRRAARGARARPHPHDEKQRWRGGGPARGWPREGRRRVSAPSDREGAPRGDLRAGGGPQAREGPGAPRGGGDRHARQRARRRLGGAEAEQLHGRRRAPRRGARPRGAGPDHGRICAGARGAAGPVPGARPLRAGRRGADAPLDEMARRNLELVEPLRPGTAGATLLEVLDGTVTPMGARLLRGWLLAPLVDPEAINARLDAVAVLADDTRGRDRLREALRSEEHTSELQSRLHLVWRLLLEKKKKTRIPTLVPASLS